MNGTVVIKAHVVYESMFGNTEALAHAIAEGPREAGVEVRVTEVSTAPPADHLDAELLVIGAPTHAFSLSRASTRSDAVRQGAPASRQRIGLREWLNAAHGDARGPRVAVFDTRVSTVRRLPMAAGPRAAKLAGRRGFRLEARPHAFTVQDVQGPLTPGELDRARAWGRELAAGGGVR